jgi:hypothetical protein
MLSFRRKPRGPTHDTGGTSKAGRSQAKSPVGEYLSLSKEVTANDEESAIQIRSSPTDKEKSTTVRLANPNFGRFCIAMVQWRIVRLRPTTDQGLLPFKEILKVS